MFKGDPSAKDDLPAMLARHKQALDRFDREAKNHSFFR
jgi:hypothetical protein